MFLSTKLKNCLLGDTAHIEGKRARVSIWEFPSVGEGDKMRHIEFPFADGFLLYLIKRIEKLEERVEKLEVKKS